VKNININIKEQIYNILLGFHRLKIIGLDDNGIQPFYDDNIYLLCNGEIYNYKNIIEKYNLKIKIESDCYVILEIYKKYGIKKLLEIINGEFAFILLDKNIGKIYICRDIFGIRPLYSNIDNLKQNDELHITSEGKFSNNIDKNINEFSHNKLFENENINNAINQLTTFQNKTVIETKQIDPGYIYTIDINNNIKLESKEKYFNIEDYKKVNNNNNNMPVDGAQLAKLFSLSEDVQQSADFIEQEFHSSITPSCCTSTPEYIRENLKNILIKTISERLHSDRDIGFLLSGGLDSSLILTIAINIIYNNRNKYEYIFNNGINVFSIGLDDDNKKNDIYYSKILIEFLRKNYPNIIINHHVVNFTVVEGIQRINELIYIIESYDQTTIRAALPMYLLSEYIKNNTNVKVVLSGEGADELFGGYLYFHSAPTKMDFHNENIKLLKDIHYFDVLRSDRCISSNGLELRVPFLDKKLIHYVLSLNYDDRIFQGEIEKKLLRDSFINYLPRNILYRQKEAFSQGVGLGWMIKIKEYCFNNNITEDDYYKQIYIKHGYNLSNIPYKWLPNQNWVNTNGESSAHILQHYNK
tara:strand:+ start:617 stop:2365 length:1749 start_codon:yes stop_codon:yes gene_type:complete